MSLRLNGQKSLVHTSSLHDTILQRDTVNKYIVLQRYTLTLVSLVQPILVSEWSREACGSLLR